MTISNLTRVLVYDTMRDLDGNPQSGQTTFSASLALVDEGIRSELLPTGYTVAWDTSPGDRVDPPATVDDLGGSFAVSLVACDDPDAAPAGWAYTVKHRSASGAWSSSFTVQVPSDHPAMETLDDGTKALWLGELVPLASAPTVQVPYATMLRTTDGPPASDVGRAGDWAIDPAASVLYGPKDDTGWPDGVSLIGPPGDPAELIDDTMTSTSLAWSSQKTSDTIAALFRKTDRGSVVLAVDGDSASVKAGTVVGTPAGVVSYAADEPVTMPALAAGTDYFVYVTADGPQAVASTDPAPDASRLIGGFHYAPGGNATGQAGGDSTPAINPFSCWDLQWKPACADPRGMTLVAGWFWADIYLCNTDTDSRGTSALGVQIVDGSSPAKVPAAFGGDGTAAYSDCNWWTMAEILAAHGKRLPSYAEFAALAYGTTEASSVGADPGTTKLQAAYTSKWGVIQATGVMWQWSSEFGGPYAGTSWSAITGGRGSVYNQPNAAFLGGDWSDGSHAGSRCSLWGDGPSYSNDSIGGRGACDHLNLA